MITTTHLLNPCLHFALVTLGAIFWSGVSVNTQENVFNCTLLPCEVTYSCGLDRPISRCNETSGECYCPPGNLCTKNEDCTVWNGTLVTRLGPDCARRSRLLPSCCWKKCNGDTHGYCRCKLSALLGCQGGRDGIEVSDNNC